MSRPGRNVPLLGMAVTVVVLVALIVGGYVAGSPAEARLRRMDQRRVEDLQRARYLLARYWTRHGRLPLSLDSLAPLSGDTSGFRDPVSGLAYDYRTTSDSTYELCAEFARPGPEEWQRAREEEWRHPGGRYCFPLAGPASHTPLLPN